MTEKILHYLNKIEAEKDIKILLACETGSRAWGFPSPDSDFDIRIIYVHKLDWYLTINNPKDTIEMMLENNDIDISGWELRKSLQLLAKSNPALLERLQSPIIYKADAQFIEKIKPLAQACYSKIATMHHYLNMAKKMIEDIDHSKEYKLKRFFYALRTSTACLWILEKDEMPPIEFSKMLDGLTEMSAHKERIMELIALKSTISEAYFHTGDKELIEFMQKCIDRASNEANSLATSKGNVTSLNTFLASQVQQEWK